MNLAVQLLVFEDGGASDLHFCARVVSVVAIVMFAWFVVRMMISAIGDEQSLT